MSLISGKRIKGRCCLDNGVAFHVALHRPDEGEMQEAHESERLFCALESVCVNLPLSRPSNVKANAAAKADRLRYLTYEFAMSIFLLTVFFFNFVPIICAFI